jgi:hypothetical protein
MEERPLYGTEAVVEAEQPAEPEEYPTFEVGEEIELKGYPFVVLALNASSIKLRPVPPSGEHSARRVMRRLRV